MKLRDFLISLFIMLVPVVSEACGPYDALVENCLRFHFYQGDEITEYAGIQKKRNIKLWHSLTSASIPDEDIEEGVYNSSLKDLETAFRQGSDNRFLNWIYVNHKDSLIKFLLTAKELEELRANRVSAWYFPTGKDGFDAAVDEKNKFAGIIETCNMHQTGLLADRYALQAIRAYMSIGEYQEAIGYYNSQLVNKSDSNLFKEMAKGYVAGCLARLGDTERANRIFVEIGNYVSMSGDYYDNFEMMAKINPESPILKSRLNGFIGYGDSVRNVRYLKLSDLALSSPKVRHKGDWLYLKAYIEAIYNRDFVKSSSYIKQARRKTFSTKAMSRDARIFDICMDAANGRFTNLMSNFIWAYNAGNSEIRWFYLIPGLLKQERTVEALLLANYDTALRDDFFNEAGDDCFSYANTGFQLLLSCKADKVVAYKYALDNGTTPMARAFRSHIRHESDFLNEVIGTLYLREGNYRKAEHYLSLVTTDYQRKMNIYKGGYLKYDPFVYCYVPEDKWYHPWYKYSDEYFDEYDHDIRPNVNNKLSKKLSTQLNAKLNFAREMVRLQNVMRHGNNSDESNLAELYYTIGRYNSFNTCWALTQYWCGNSEQCNYEFFHWNWDGSYTGVGDYINYVPSEMIRVNKDFEKNIIKIFNKLKSPEALAEANFMLRNYRTIAKHYSQSKEGKWLAVHCDNWKNWL